MNKPNCIVPLVSPLQGCEASDGYIGLCGKEPTESVSEESGVRDINAAAEVDPRNPLDLSFFVLSRMVRRFCKMAFDH